MNEERGIITSIYLENFVTYDNVVIKPGRNLNVIIGPNGTGKSTIVCAIVIGFGGKPKLIGRSSTIGAYVKHGKKVAKVEIKMKDTDDKQITIERTFDVANHSSWKLNGKEANAKDIQDLTKSFNIQVDNLCQLLPQDKVQDFSKMDPQELLHNTEKSVGDPKLLEYHEQLKEFRRNEKNFAANVANKKRLLASETQKYEGMKEIVNSIKAKKAIMKKIVSLRQKRVWICYDQSRLQLVEAKKDRDRAAEKMKKLDTKLKPMNQEIKKLEAEIKQLKKSAEAHNTQMVTRSAKISRLKNEITNYGNEIKSIEDDQKFRVQAEENRDQEINIMVVQKNKHENDLQRMIEDIGSEEKLLADQKNLSFQFEAKRVEVTKVNRDISLWTTKLEQVDSTTKMIGLEARAAKDVDTKRLETLRQRNQDAHRAVLWLRDNRDKFKCTIHEPMMLTLNVKDADYAKYFENLISYRDLTAFVCEDKSDMNLLLRNLRDEQKLTINVLHSDPNKHVDLTPANPLEHLRQFGFQHYLISLIEAPETIIKYLVSMYRIHNIPIGTSAVQDNVDRIPSNLRLFFSPSSRFSVRSSKYSGAKSTSVGRIQPHGTLSIIQDTKKLRELMTKQEKLNQSREEILEDLNSFQEVLKKLNEELEARRNAKQTLQRHFQTIQALKDKVTATQRKINESEKGRMTIADIKIAAQRVIQRILKNCCKKSAEYNEILADAFKHEMQNVESQLELEMRKHKFAAKVEESQELRDSCKNVEELFMRLDKALEPLKLATKKLYETAMTQTNQINPQNPDFKQFNTAFAKLPTTLEDIDAELEVALAKAYCITETANGDQILQNYETTREAIERLEHEIEVLGVEQGTIMARIDEIRLMWLNPLRELIQRINVNFSSYFSMMGCAGEVTIREADNIHDYDQYGLMIRVKFRDADDLQELTRQRQSGGERAVTTAVYMIALQELSTVPFRCVDEINQGMDSINERRVFELIVKITARPQTSQYFLLTPKLLPGLHYGDYVDVHCVFNGSFMLPSSQLTTEDYVERLRRSNRSR